jgi:hypothetical protein
MGTRWWLRSWGVGAPVWDDVRTRLAARADVRDPAVLDADTPGIVVLHVLSAEGVEQIRQLVLDHSRIVVLTTGATPCRADVRRLLGLGVADVVSWEDPVAATARVGTKPFASYSSPPYSSKGSFVDNTIRLTEGDGHSFEVLPFEAR